MVNTAPNASTAQKGGNRNKPSSSKAPRITPVTTRVLSIGLRRHLGRGFAEAALPLAEVIEGVVEMRRRKLRPESLGEIELGIGEIPKQEIADALLASG